MNFKNKLLLIFLGLSFCFLSKAQSIDITVEEAIQMAINNHQGLKASSARIEQAESLVNSAFDLDKTRIQYSFDQNNIAPNGLALNVWGINQTFRFPTIYKNQKDVKESLVNLNEESYLLNERLVSREVTKAYYQVVYWTNMTAQYQQLDTLYSSFSLAAKQKFDAGESNMLEKLTAENKQKSIGIALKKSQEQIIRAVALLRQWTQTEDEINIPLQEMPVLGISMDSLANPGLSYHKVMITVSENELKLARQQLLPDIELGIFRGTNQGVNARTYTGFQAGIALPLWFGAEKARIAAAKKEQEINQFELSNYESQLEGYYLSLISEINALEESIKYYKESGQELSSELIKHASEAFKSGEIDYLQYTQLIENALDIEITYLKDLLQYNHKVIEVNYLMLPL